MRFSRLPPVLFSPPPEPPSPSVTRQDPTVSSKASYQRLNLQRFCPPPPLLTHLLTRHVAFSIFETGSWRKFF